MYSTCIHCNAKLGANEVIEMFPVGRRLAFDAAKGRLWVVCPKCHRWNLTPLEERWEAIEECERQFRGTKLRASTDNIGLAKLSEGLELVRIGAPQRPEMAAWRYAREFKRRWMTREVPLTGALVTYSVLAMMNSAELFNPVVVFGGLAFVTVSGFFMIKRGGEARVVLPDGRVTRLTFGNTMTASLHPDEEHGWAVECRTGNEDVVARGPAAQRTLRGVLTASNSRGGRDKRISEAISLLQGAGGAESYLRRLALAARATNAPQISGYPADVRLALEMALHEDSERRALEGELAGLEADWALAEEIGHIADNMFVPANVLDRLTAARDGGPT